MKKSVVTAVLIVGLASIAMAGPGMGKGMRGGGRGDFQCMGRGDGGSGPRGHLMMLADELELTEQQRDQLDKMRSEFQLEMVDQRAALQKAQIKLRTLGRDDASENQVLMAIDEVAMQRSAIQKQRYQHQQQMRSVLTAEQQEKLKSLRGKGICDGDGPHGRRCGHSGRHGGRGQGCWGYDAPAPDDED